MLKSNTNVLSPHLSLSCPTQERIAMLHFPGAHEILWLVMVTGTKSRNLYLTTADGHEPGCRKSQFVSPPLPSAVFHEKEQNGVNRRRNRTWKRRKGRGSRDRNRGLYLANSHLPSSASQWPSSASKLLSSDGLHQTLKLLMASWWQLHKNNPPFLSRGGGMRKKCLLKSLVTASVSALLCCMLCREWRALMTRTAALLNFMDSGDLSIVCLPG